MQYLSVGGTISVGVSMGRAFVTAGATADVGSTLAQSQRRICVFGLNADQTALGDWNRLHIGAMAIWSPALWRQKLQSNRSLRRQIRRARHKGASLCEGPGDENQLAECQQEWLEGQGLPPLHFLGRAVDTDHLQGKFILRAEVSGQVVAFLVASKVPVRNAWVVEQIARIPSAPNGAVELLIHAAMIRFADLGVGEVSLGLAPLADCEEWSDDASPCVRWALRRAKAIGGTVYNFKGIEQFKRKLRPDRWEPVYAVANFKWSWRSLAELLRAFTGESWARTALRLIEQRLESPVGG